METAGLRAVAVLAVGLTLVFAGCLGPGPVGSASGEGSSEASSESLDDALARWDFTGYSGNVTLEIENLTWFHFAQPLGENKAYSNFSIYWDFGQIERGTGGTKFRAYFMWFSNDTSPERVVPYYSAVMGQSGGSWRSGDVYVHAAGQDERIPVEHPVPHPGQLLWGESHPRQRTQMANNMSRHDVSQMIGHVERPVLNKLVLLHSDGRQPAAPVLVNGSWHGTPLTFTYGTADDGDFFAHRFREQDGTVHAGATVPGVGTAFAGEGFEFTDKLVEPGRAVFFVYRPSHAVGYYGAGGSTVQPMVTTEAGLARPNGSGETWERGVDSLVWWPEVSTQEGEWTFWAEASAGRYLFDHALYGISFDPARPPWVE